MQSHVVSGYVGNKNAVFALNRLGFEVDALNTTQLSNHTGFPEVTGQRLGGADVRALWDGMKANGLTNQTHVLSGYVALALMARGVSVSWSGGWRGVCCVACLVSWVVSRITMRTQRCVLSNTRRNMSLLCLR